MHRKITSRKEALKEGHKHYYTGQLCAHGHDSDRFTSTGTCCLCGKERSLQHYHQHRLSWSNCATQYRKKRLKRDKEWYRRRNYKSLYKITLEKVDQMLVDQQNSCAICKSEFTSAERAKYYVDHNHLSGVVRGLLCANCNFLIGHAKEDLIVLQAAIDYLRNEEIA